MYCGLTKVPHVFEVGNGSMMVFSETSAFWLFNQVSNLAYTRYNLMIPFIQEKQQMLEQKFIDEVKAFDEKAKNIKDKEELTEALNDFSGNSSQITFNEWKSLYQFLFTRYMDGNVKSAKEVPENYIYVNPELEQPGYSPEWYKKLIEDSGEKFLYQGEESH
jgi:dipeptidase